VIPPAIFFYYSTLFDSRFKTLQQNPFNDIFQVKLNINNSKLLEPLQNILLSSIYFKNYT
ncbi:hypothetical protein LDA84_13205, partial [Enterococcus faecium]